MPSFGRFAVPARAVAVVVIIAIIGASVVAGVAIDRVLLGRRSAPAGIRTSTQAAQHDGLNA